MCHQAPHGPRQPDAKATNKIGQNMTKTDTKEDPPPGLDYAGLRQWAYQRYMQDCLRCVASVDDNVGRVLDNTIVISTSDGASSSASTASSIRASCTRSRCACPS